MSTAERNKLNYSLGHLSLSCDIKLARIKFAGHSAPSRLWQSARNIQSRLGRLQKWLRRSHQGVLDRKRKHLHTDQRRRLRAENRARRLWRQQEVNISNFRRPRVMWTHFWHLFDSNSSVITGMHNIHTSKSTPKPITTNLKSMASRELRAIRWMIWLMGQTTVHSPRTTEIMTEARWIVPACSRFVDSADLIIRNITFTRVTIICLEQGGWWWKSCGRGLNGLYLRDPHDIAAKQGIIWFTWRGWDYTLKKSTMMIRSLSKSMTSWRSEADAVIQLKFPLNCLETRRKKIK